MKRLLFSAVIMVAALLPATPAVADTMNKYYSKNFKGWKGIVFMCQYDSNLGYLKEACQRTTADLELLAASHKIDLKVAEPNNTGMQTGIATLQKRVELTYSIVATLAKRVGCDWHTAKKYIDEYPTVRQAYDDECETVNDVAESTLITAIKDGDVASAKWWLTKKRKQQFGDAVDITSAGEAIQVVSVGIDVDKL